jgi:vacuolar-type H+-ATPase subunit H
MADENITTEQLIKPITEAEEKATEIKRVALARATAILSDAEIQAANMEKSTAEVCKAYRERERLSAIEDAEKEYRATIQSKENSAKAYCTNALEKSSAIVEQIVGRIVGGNR